MTRAKKSLGQHFLTDRRVIERIIKSVSPQPNDLIVEIGPGRGALTRPLATQCRFLLAAETDRELAESLAAELGSERVRIITGDALKLKWNPLIESARADFGRLDSEIAEHIRVRVVANLPYYISTPILQMFIALRNQLYDMTLMLQEEVVDRIASGPGSREYGYLSVLCQLYCEIEKLFRVAPSAFAPAPDVWSAVLRLTVRRQPLVAVGDEPRFLLLVRSAFAQRRKTIMNNLRAAAPVLSGQQAPAERGAKIDFETSLKEAGIDPRRRAESFSIAEFGALYRAIYGESHRASRE